MFGSFPLSEYITNLYSPLSGRSKIPTTQFTLSSYQDTSHVDQYGNNPMVLSRCGYSFSGDQDNLQVQQGFDYIKGEWDATFK